MKPKQIELYIDELVLDGFETRDQHGVGMALQIELQRLFVEQGIPALLTEGTAVPLLRGGEANIAAGAGAQAIGTHVAQRIYSGLRTSET